ncbi:MAG: TIGR02302 family protein [Alphaproteobacteria bacterium HGW-Alphaproteobacteria-12]|nr:MAG: TIGR02302 family protein [Alphaproteobacteria bacterium HGW-Alphaproteobacteria-12]
MSGPTDDTPKQRRPTTRGTPLPRRVERRVRVARALLFWDALLPALWPATGLAGLFVTLALFGLFTGLPLLVHWTLLAGFGAVMVSLLWHGFRGFSLPTRDDALRHLEKSSGLSHTPLSSYEDVVAPESGDPALWAAHRRWIVKRLRKLHLRLPQSTLTLRDPYALRAIVLILLVAGLAGTGPGRLARVADALLPGAAGARIANIEAWITPPPYTGKPPLYLERNTEAEAAKMPDLAVPQDSTLSIRVHGLKNAPVLESHGEARGKPEALATVSEGNYAIDANLSGTTDLALTEGGRIIRAWHIRVQPDEAPQIELTGPIGKSASDALRFTYKVSDDYGVVSADARIALDRTELPKDEESAPTPQPRVTAPDIALSLPERRPRSATGATYAELTAHPWAGLPVTITLTAQDDKGQEGKSAPVNTVLPARNFTDPLARAIVEQRRRLALDPRSGLSVARFLDNFTQDADRYIDDKVVYLSLRAAYWRLTEATRDTDLTGIFDLLWSVALRIEDGDLSLAERDLRDARKALADALAEGADSEEIARLMDEMKDAFERYMEAMAAQQGADDLPFMSGLPDGDVQTIDRSELESMMDAIRKLTESGAREQAQAMLDRLQNILENLQAPNRNAQMGPGDKAMSQAIERIGELIAKQRDVMDRTFRELEAQRGDEEAGQTPGIQTGGDALDGLSGEQGSLNEELDAIVKMLKDKDTQEPDALRDAQGAMKSAQDRLDAGRADRAAGSQGEAIERMQTGAQALADKLMQGRSRRGNSGPASERDPLNRATGPLGNTRGLKSAVPDEIDIQRAREILEELRRRAAELERPQIELDYLDRLLRQF